MQRPDLVLKNANVITMNPGQPRAELVVVNGDRISLVADSDVLDSLPLADTRIIDCQGMTVIPGFNDAHCHVFSFIRKLLSVDLSPDTVSSIADIKAAIRHRARNIPPRQWITGTDYNEFYLTERRCPHRWDLDEAAPDHPVVISHRSLHACVLNSLALSRAGITQQTPEPPGAMIDRELDSGEPSGILYEMLGFIREKVLPPLTPEDLTRGIALANHQYLTLGITSLQEATVSNNLSRWQTFCQFRDSGRLNSRVALFIGAQARQQCAQAGLSPGYGDHRLRLGGVKIIINETTGKLRPPPAELNELVLDAHRAGFQLAIHGIEERTVAAAIAALEYAQHHLPQAGKRHRIEHCSECPDHLLQRLRRLPAMVVTQPPFIYYGGERYLATLSPPQLKSLYRINSFLTAGLVVAGSSDSPVVPNNPLVGIYAAVTRQAESGQTVPPAEAISPSQALALYTVNAAYASGEEAIKGSITPGKLADLVVLSNDPTAVPPPEIPDIRVMVTIIGGKVVWEA